jgi:predicted enzyme related to lactoylglutathione lyase
MKRPIARSVPWIAIAVAIAAVAGVAAAPAAKVTGGTFVWHDLVTTDATKARAFYSAMFGWTFEPGKGVDPGYTIIKHQGLPIGGIVTPKEQVDSQWLSYVVAPDVDKAVDAFKQAGGRVFRGPLNARKDLRVAAVADAQGAPIGLASHGPMIDLPGGVPEVNRWLWMDYVARDAAPAIEFYSRVLGFKSEVGEARQDFTYYLLSNERPRAGLFQSPLSRETAVWLPYIRVADAAAAAEKVKMLGGSIVVEPGPRIRNGSLAIVRDPNGAPIALQKYPFDAGVKP